MPGGIIPWSGGTRTPITYGLRPGQFRNTRVNVFPNQTIINNNIGNFGTYGYYDDCCGGGGNKMGWFDWTMLGGMGLNFFGNLLGCVFGGSSKKSEGPGDTPTPRSDLDLKNLNALYKADGYTIVQNEDGSFTAKKKGEPAITGKDRAELESLLNDAMKKPEAVVQPIVTEDDGASNVAGAGNTPATDENPAEGITKKSDFGKLFTSEYMNGNYDPTKGLKVGDTYYQTPADAFRAYSGNDVVKPENANDLNNILKDIKGIYDDGKDSRGNDIKDFKAATATLTSGTTYKNGDTVKIGNHNYKIEINDGYLCFVDTNPTGGSNNTQRYMLEKTSDGKYQLHQRLNIIYNNGVGKIAH